MKVFSTNGDEVHASSRFLLESDNGDVYEVQQGHDNGMLYLTALNGKQIVIRPSGGFSQIAIAQEQE